MGPSDSRATVGGPLVRWYPNEPEVGSKKYPKRPFYINIIYIYYIYMIYMDMDMAFFSLSRPGCLVWGRNLFSGPAQSVKIDLE